MRVIPSTEVRMTPMHCAVVPTIGQMSGHRFIDTGYDMYINSVNTPNRVYVSEPAVHEMAVQLGWTPPQQVQALAAELAAAQDRLTVALTRAEEAEAALAAVRVLKNQGGFVQANPPGRPKKVAA
jgi:hypothetical protein